MYAIIKTGGKQYRVSEGDVLNIEKLDVEAGSEVVFDEVLTVVADSDVKIGKPVVDGAKVTAKVVEHGKAEKIFVFKYKAKSNYRKRQGHRQRRGLPPGRQHLHGPVHGGRHRRPRCEGGGRGHHHGLRRGPFHHRRRHRPRHRHHQLRDHLRLWPETAQGLCEIMDQKRPRLGWAFLKQTMERIDTDTLHFSCQYTI